MRQYPFWQCANKVPNVSPDIIFRLRFTVTVLCFSLNSSCWGWRTIGREACIRGGWRSLGMQLACRELRSHYIHKIKMNGFVRKIWKISTLFRNKSWDLRKTTTHTWETGGLTIHITNHFWKKWKLSKADLDKPGRKGGKIFSSPPPKKSHFWFFIKNQYFKIFDRYTYIYWLPTEILMLETHLNHFMYRRM